MWDGLVADQCGEGDEGDDVGKDHELVEEVLEFPDEVVLDDGAEEDECDAEDGVDDRGAASEEVMEVDFAEVVPAEDRGIREEEQADGDEDASGGVSGEGCEGVLDEVGLGTKKPSLGVAEICTPLN